MRFKLIAALCLLAVATPATAATMSVANFLQKSEVLKKKGALALFSGDLKLLMNQIKADSVSLRAENQALASVGKRKAYCTPDGFKMHEEDILEAMKAVPAERRAATSTKAALRDYLARLHPCKS